MPNGGKGEASASPDSLRYSGPALVAGSAECLHDDLASAWKLYPNAPVVAVNGASREVKAIMLVSQHPERFSTLGWMRNQERLFGEGFTTHSNREWPGVDVVWGLKNGGGSAWLARKIAALCGFSPVVLCGVPMLPGPYAGGQSLTGLMHREDVVGTLFAQIEADTAWHEGVISMSGRTKELFS